MNNFIKLNGPIVHSIEETKYLVIFLHGWGSDGNDLIQLADFWKNELKSATFHAPNGPDLCSANPLGRQWFEINQEKKTDMVSDLNRSYESLKNYINSQLNDKGLPDRNYFLVGFSQGTMISIYYALRNKCLGILGYSGAFINQNIPKKTEINDFFLMHGKDDSIVPVEKMYEAKDSLNSLSNNVKTLEFEKLEHSISEKGLHEGINFIKNRI